MNGLATAAQDSAIGAVFFIVMILAVFVVFAIAGYVQAHKEGRALRLKKALRSMFIVLGVLFLVGVSLVYYQGASARAKASRFHRVLSDADGGRYTAEYAYLRRDQILLRVYRTSDMSLLAERTYSYPEAARLVWAKDMLIYDASSDADGEINLPPSLYDRITARLP